MQMVEVDGEERGAQPAGDGVEEAVQWGNPSESGGEQAAGKVEHQILRVLIKIE